MVEKRFTTKYCIEKGFPYELMWKRASQESSCGKGLCKRVYVEKKLPKKVHMEKGFPREFRWKRASQESVS